MKKFFFGAIAAAAIAVILLGSVFYVAGNSNTVVIGMVPDPRDTVTSFFDSISSGDFTRAMEYVDNYESLGFENVSSDIIETFKRKLTDSYEYELLEEGSSVSGLTAKENMKITFLDSNALFADAGEKASAAAMEYKRATGSIESDDIAMSFVNDAIIECLNYPEAYYTTEYLTVTLRYDGSEWKIIIDDRLLAAVYGNFGIVSSEGVETNE